MEGPNARGTASKVLMMLEAVARSSGATSPIVKDVWIGPAMFIKTLLAIMRTPASM